MGLVGGGAPRSHLPQGPATLGWSLFGAAQVEPEPRFLGLGCMQTARHSSQRRTLWNHMDAAGTESDLLWGPFVAYPPPPQLGPHALDRADLLQQPPSQAQQLLASAAHLPPACQSPGTSSDEVQSQGFFGSWFDHVKGWLGLQKDLNLLFVTYEELHQEPRRTIQKLSEFLGHPLGPEEEDVVLEHCSFSFMSQSNMVNYSLLSKEIIDQSQGKFLRKGVVGDWREHFTPELDEKFNTVYQSKMGNSGLCLPWTMD
ncbi:sulfotransferase 2B1-like isoform X4 [Peromyscus maniculatus bairdii]|uniref:sulfotransferase 2B1-like isoform X4 n=1 Tax=Peromyscus maniculatus bairdii TaxID=230844 RepID=UPI003FD5EC12